MSNVPGINAIHAVITPTCRQNRGDDGAFDEAMDRLREQYRKTLEIRGEDGAEYHVVLSVESKREGRPVRPHRSGGGDFPRRI